MFHKIDYCYLENDEIIHKYTVPLPQATFAEKEAVWREETKTLQAECEGKQKRIEHFQEESEK